MIAKINYNLLRSTTSDFDFLFELNKITMKDHVIATWGKWDEDWQKNYFKEKFKPEDYQIILVDNKNAGALAITENEQQISIDRLQIMPEFQGFGIGSLILDDLIVKAQETKKFLSLNVLKSNTRAKELYEKKSFKVTGKNDERYFLTYT